MGFYRDLLLLVAGILIVGAVVFGGLSLWAGRGGDEPPPTTETAPPTTPATRVEPTSPPTTEATTTTVADTTTSPPTTLRDVRVPSEVRVVVLNSIGVTGLAAALSEELAELGYQVATPGNYSPELSDTMIFHAEGFSLEALELAEAIPDGTVAPNPDITGENGVDIVVVIGRSYQE